jgi:hypothetical protein
MARGRTFRQIVELGCLKEEAAAAPRAGDLAIAVAAFGCALLAYKASAAQHQARLMEMARPSCHDEKMNTDRELHRPVAMQKMTNG